MNSRNAIYVLNAVLKRRADAQFEKLAAEKAVLATLKAKAKAEAGAQHVEQLLPQTQTRQKTDPDDYSTGAELSDGNTNGDSQVMRPVHVVSARRPDDNGAITLEQTEISAGIVDSEVQRIATQRSLLEGMAVAGVLTTHQCEAAVAELATQK
jgi:hypothetical protein